MTNDKGGVLAYGGVRLSGQVKVFSWHETDLGRISAVAG